MQARRWGIAQNVITAERRAGRLLFCACPEISVGPFGVGWWGGPPPEPLHMNPTIAQHAKENLVERQRTTSGTRNHHQLQRGRTIRLNLDGIRADVPQAAEAGL